MPEPSVLVVKNGVKIFSATSAEIAEPLLVISICMRSSASIFCGISFRFLPQIYPPHEFSKFLGGKLFNGLNINDYSSLIYNNIYY